MLRLLLIFALANGHAHAQNALSLHQDYYHYTKEAGSLVPMIFYESSRDVLLMARYNYEAENSFSFFAGKNFQHATLSITPSVGLVAGAASGLSLTTQAAWEKNQWFASAEPQYCHFFSGEKPYFFNWSEAGIQPAKNIFAGLALQSTKELSVKGWLHEPGIFFGGTIGNIELPFYLFRNKDAALYMVAGVHWQWQQKQRSHK